MDGGGAMIRIATRRSALALCQAHYVSALLQSREPQLEIRLHDLTTEGDRADALGQPEPRGKGRYVRELQHALLVGDADLAVHALKDLPTDGDPRLSLGAIPPRSDPSDALCATAQRSLEQLPTGARVGTSSLRRAAQLRAARPDLAIVPVQGSLESRLARVGAELDAVVVAYAGLVRLGLEAQATQVFTPEQMLSACGQGSLAVEARRDDPIQLERLARIDDREAHLMALAERSTLRQLGIHCEAPVAVLASLKGEELTLYALVAAPDGSEILRSRRSGPAALLGKIARGVAQDLVAQGAHKLLGK